MAMYFLTQRGRTADPKDTPAGQIIQHLQEEKRGTLTNPERVAYALSSDVASIKATMDTLVKAGLLGRDDGRTHWGPGTIH